MDSIIDRAKRGEIIVLDGAMGTMLQARVPGLKCVEEANLSAPEAVGELHRAYAEAGADAVTTNSLCANAITLDRHGLREKAYEMARRSAEIAKGAVGDSVAVAGSIGSVGQMIEPLGPVSIDQLRDAFREPAQALKDGGVDLILVETMYNLDEAALAVEVAAKMDVPLLATMSFDKGAKTLMGNTPAECARRLSDCGASALGSNCGTGPEEMLVVAEEMRRATELPLLFQPNAGSPRLERGETRYDATPEVMADYARRYLEAGAQMIGSCCGSTPEFTRAIAHVARGFARPSS